MEDRVTASGILHDRGDFCYLHCEGTSQLWYVSKSCTAQLIDVKTRRWRLYCSLHNRVSALIALLKCELRIFGHMSTTNQRWWHTAFNPQSQALVLYLRGLDASKSL